MKYARAIAFAALAGITIVSAGCAVGRGQETTGAYIDDAGITTAVKARFIEDRTVSASSISTFISHHHCLLYRYLYILLNFYLLLHLLLHLSLSLLSTPPPLPPPHFSLSVFSSSTLFPHSPVIGATCSLKVTKQNPEEAFHSFTFESSPPVAMY